MRPHPGDELQIVHPLELGALLAVPVHGLALALRLPGRLNCEELTAVWADDTLFVEMG